MEGEGGALDLTASNPHIAVVVLNSIYTKADTHVLKAMFKILCLDTCLYDVIHQSYASV